MASDLIGKALPIHGNIVTRCMCGIHFDTRTSDRSAMERLRDDKPERACRHSPTPSPIGPTCPRRVAILGRTASRIAGVCRRAGRDVAVAQRDRRALHLRQRWAVHFQRAVRQAARRALLGAGVPIAGVAVQAGALVRPGAGVLTGCVRIAVRFPIVGMALVDRVQSLLASIPSEPIHALAVVLAVPVKAHPAVLARCRLALICRITGIALLVVIHGTVATVPAVRLVDCRHQ